MSTEDSKLLSFKPKSQGSLHPVRKKYDSCKHKYTVIDEEKRTVECRDCNAPLDPFSVLWELACEQRRFIDDVESWKAVQESRLAERYDEVWLEHAGDITEPPSEPEIRKVWDVFHEYFGDKFKGMYRRKTRLKSGMEWYGRGGHGCCVSLIYARQALTQKCITPEPNKVECPPSAS